MRGSRLQQTGYINVIPDAFKIPQEPPENLISSHDVEGLQ
jgi:hypothetical protein